MSFKITGTGSAVPKLVLSNDEMAKIVDTSDEWIVSKTGIKTRRVMTEENITGLAFAAAERALEDAAVLPEEIDLIIAATMCGDYFTPSLACAVQGRLKAWRAFAFDVNAACSGFVYALDTAAGFFERKKIKKALIIAAEGMSRFLDFGDRATCVLFGDGAGAAVLSEGEGFLSSYLNSIGNEDIMNIPSSLAARFSGVERKNPYLKMNGQEVYRFAVSAMSGDVIKVVEAAGLNLSDISYILPHQANIRIINAAAEKLGLDNAKIITNIEHYGNMSAASIPVLMDGCRKNNLFKRGDILVLSAFGGGLTTGACAIKWGI